MKTTAKKKAPEGKGAAGKAYLVAYNLVQTLGWAFVAYKAVMHLTSGQSGSLWDAVSTSLIIFQTGALLEVVHAAVGLVPSNPIITGAQIASRVLLLAFALVPTQMGKHPIGLPLILFAWCITEVIRYAYYALNLVATVPKPFTWLRYSTFLPLYPLGVTGELLCYYGAQREIAQTGALTFQMPNAMNFIFNARLIIWFMMFLYFPLFPKLFMHMVNQRRKMVGGASAAKKAK